MKLENIKIFSFLASLPLLVNHHIYAVADAWPTRAGCPTAAQIGLKSIIFNIYGSYRGIFILLGGILFIAGVLFVIFSFFKLKQFRDNPQQVTIGMPLTYLFIGVGLIYLPTLILDVRATFYGNNTPSNYGIFESLDQAMAKNKGFGFQPTQEFCGGGRGGGGSTSISQSSA